MTEDYKGQCEFCFKYFPEEKLTVKECGIWSKVCCEGCLAKDSGVKGLSEDLTAPGPDLEPEPVKANNQLNLF